MEEETPSKYRSSPLVSFEADGARFDGNSLSSAFTEEAEGKGDVPAKPVDALQAPVSEVLTVSLLTVHSEPAQLDKIIFPGMTMYKISTSMIIFSKLLLNFAPESEIAG